MLNLQEDLGYSVFFDPLQEKISKRFQAKKAEDIRQFSACYFRASVAHELINKKPDDLYGELISTWQFIEHFDNQAKVRVFNPSIETDGWQSSHTIVEVLALDMPFMVSSIRQAINKAHIAIHTILNTVLWVNRSDCGRVIVQPSTGTCNGEFRKEAIIHLEIGRISSPERMNDLQNDLYSLLGELKQAVGDFPAMLQKAADIREELENAASVFDPDVVSEAQEFITWLTYERFTFLGLKEYQFSVESQTYTPISKSKLGLLKLDQDIGILEKIEPGRRVKNPIIECTKSLTKSRIHRPAYLDIIAIKKFDASGRHIGEYRFLGLYTSAAYSHTPFEIPTIRRKLEVVKARAGFETDSYDGKELQRILDIYPKDELFQISTEQLFLSAIGILQIKERRQVRLFIREDAYGRFVSCLIFTPRDRFSTELRKKFEHILGQVFTVQDSQFDTQFSESLLTRLYLVLRVAPTSKLTYNIRDIEARLIQAYRSWDDDLHDALVEEHGEENGNLMAVKYRQAFAAGYKENFAAKAAVLDIHHMEILGEKNPLGMSLYRALEEPSENFRLKLYHYQSSIPLSDVIPVLENMGLRILGEHPYEINKLDSESIWIHDFSVSLISKKVINLDKIKQNFELAFRQVCNSKVDSDKFNTLVLSAGMNWREIVILRAYAKYLKQLGFGLSQEYIEETLNRYVAVTRQIVELWEIRFNPDRDETKREQEEKVCVSAIETALDSVSTLNEDRILREYMNLVNATVRTNFYQFNSEGDNKDYLVIKLRPRQLSIVPQPVPLYEIFVFSPRIEGVHLRTGKVARGGLRWSDRLEDYRTEILGLVKAQQVKNSVIVPVGAKGGFVAKNLSQNASREETLEEGIACYKIFIAGLLDVTDNICNGGIVAPNRVIKKDDDDPYLVVAADKGTATFSDIANKISEDYRYWLGDAFASGGSTGYDHKKMGITARGAWVSVTRHFRELGLNVETTDFTVVGIGDMAGDVFGNGMLMSRHIRLVAAFNHEHIFIDPDPDSAISYDERKRLFKLKKSNWLSYNTDLISPGGGVFSKSAKSIPVSQEMKQLFSINGDRITPNALLMAILQAPVDLIWNGGIGTYVKSSAETNTEVGDKANDNVRTNANKIQCKVFAEGGNLGVTQLGRVEMSRRGVLCNTDFIDNSAGVDCSDHEVNIKILLDAVIRSGDLTVKQRNQILANLTKEVAALVLENNSRQTLSISIALAQTQQRLDEYQRYINTLEVNGYLNRELEFLPSDEELFERKTQNIGLTRPELSILFAYTKNLYKEALIKSDLINNEYLLQEMEHAFPAALLGEFQSAIYNHPLKKEILATQLTNSIVDYMGITYVQRMKEASGALEIEVAKAFVIARDVFNLPYHWRKIAELDNFILKTMQHDMFIDLIRVVRRGSRWFLRNRRSGLEVRTEIEKFSPKVEALTKILPEYLTGYSLEYWENRRMKLYDSGVPEDLAGLIAMTPGLLSVLAIIEAADVTGHPINRVAEVYFMLGETLDLNWFGNEINQLQVNDHWQGLSRESFRDDLEWQQRSLTIAVFDNFNDAGFSASERIQLWQQRHESLIQRWMNLVAELKAGQGSKFAMYSVALRELLDLAQASSICAE